jgi:hypothetical protein
MGRNCLRAVIDHPAMELAGVYVYGADKAGKDAGEIARRERTGIIATNDVARIFALEADVVDPRGAARRTGGGLRVGRDDVARAGLNPGFAGEQLAVVATGVCTQVDQIEVIESVDCRPVRSPDYVFKILGFGAEPGAVDPNDPAWDLRRR